MLISPSVLLPIEILLNTLVNEYLQTSFCLTFVTDTELTVNIPSNMSSMRIQPNNSEFVEQILNASEKGCSDYIIKMNEPENFMIAFENVNHLGDIRRSDKKVIFLPPQDEFNISVLTDILSLNEASFAANIVLIVPTTTSSGDCTAYDMITHRFIGPDEDVQKPLFLDRWDSCTGRFEKGANLFPHDISNLNGKTVKVAAFTYKPYVLLDLDPSLSPLGRDGMEMRIIDEFCRSGSNIRLHDTALELWSAYSNCYSSYIRTVNRFDNKHLNMTIRPLSSQQTVSEDPEEFQLVDYVLCQTWVNCTVEIVRDDEHEWGEIYENNTGVGVLGNVVEDRADIAITALYSWYEEYRVLDFTAPIIRTAITCIAPAPRILTSWDLPLVPFTWPMWLCLLFTYFYASVALLIAQRSSDNIFLTTFGMMITQTHEDTKSWRIRSITGWMLMTGLIIDNAYSGGLASSFTVPKYETSIDTVHDLVDRKMEWGATHDAWIFSIMLSEEPVIKNLLSQFKTYPAETLKRKSFTRSMAFSIEHLPAGYFAIGEYITKEAAKDLEIMLDKLYYEQCVVMLRKSSPYTAKLSKLIGRLHQSGLMLSWETQVALKYLDFKVQLEVRLSRARKYLEEIEPLSLKKLLGIYIFYFGGLAIALLVFIGELIIHRGKATIVV